jgi:ribosome-binding factor A
MVKRYTKSPTSRQLKVSEEIRHAIAEIIVRGDILPPFFDNIMVTVSEVRTSVDLKIATAFLIFPNNADHKVLLGCFKELAPQIRKTIAGKLRLRYAPEIRFVVDDSVQKADKIEKLFKSLH